MNQTADIYKSQTKLFTFSNKVSQFAVLQLKFGISLE